MNVELDRLLTHQQLVHLFNTSQVVDVLIIELLNRRAETWYTLGIRTITSESILFVATRRGAFEPRKWARLDALVAFIKRELEFEGVCRLVLGRNTLAPQLSDN